MPGRKRMDARMGGEEMLFCEIDAVLLAVVVMLSVEVCTAFRPLAVRLDGENIHVAPSGRPEQEKLTLPV
jgi:hypothetical protein